MEATHYPLIRFLKEELQLPTDSITLALQHSEQIPNLLPITLWQYGLITMAITRTIRSYPSHIW
jgi:hypothetical protein